MLIERKGNWIQTFKGNQFFSIDPRIEDIDIEDIAHALSMLCRYAGHCIDFYSVAEHSVILSEYVSLKNRLWALLHDASEAYLVDVPSPIKHYLPEYKTIESRLQKVIARKFNLTEEIPHEVIEADHRILQDEKMQNMRSCKKDWNLVGNPLGVKLHYWTPKQGEEKFLLRFKELIGE
jgi:5'-nucleotidase